MINYQKLPVDLFTDQENSILFTGNNTIKVVPFDPANTDYAEYLKWLAEGNEPLPADS